MWSAGIEDTFIFDPHARTRRILDEYQLTEHYDRWADDLGLIAETGVGTARYGIPWYQANPSPSKWDWSWADQTLGRLLQLGVDPIVDLVHYGTPGWLEGGFTNPEYPARVAEYAARLAERFKGRIHWYTPLNEPRITAWYCGKLGWWPPYGRGWRGFLNVLIGACRGIVETHNALAAVDPQIVKVHVDATDLYEAMTPGLEEDAQFRQELVFLGLDLVSGKVSPGHPLWTWLLRQGVSEATLEWFLINAVQPDIVGINLYPMFTYKQVVRTNAGVRVRMKYADGSIVERLGEMYWRRYGRPVMITETASVGSIKRRQAWMDASIAAVRNLREHGVPIVGYTWWPLFALVSWGYRQGDLDLDHYLLQLGLWNLHAGPDGLERVRTSLVDSYCEAVAGSAAAVGHLQSSELVGRRA